MKQPRKKIATNILFTSNPHGIFTHTPNWSEEYAFILNRANNEAASMLVLTPIAFLGGAVAKNT